MTPSKRALCITMATAFGSGPACAQWIPDIAAELQETATRLAELALAPLSQIAGLASHPTFEFFSAELGSGRVVKGAPYAATAVSETVQTLTDGNRIQRRSTQRLARDGEGRTRTERIARDGTVASVIINDVVAQRRFVLTPSRKLALELPASASSKFRVQGDASGFVPAPPAQPAPPERPASMSSEEARSWADQMRAWAHSMSGRDRRFVTVAQPPGDGREIQVDVVRIVEAPPAAAVHGAAPSIAPLPPLPFVMPPAGTGVTTSLGSREFDGVRADGTRTTWTIPAGRIGNDKPIEVFSERWYSPELMLVVQTRHLDPRSGETTYRLTDLKRAEPDAALFKVPEGYEKRGGHNRRSQEERK